MGKTKIEWCDMTINPIIGCTKCSPGCDNCYAEKFAARLAKNPATAERYAHVVADEKWNGQLHVDFSCFEHLPKKSARIFVGSMGDVFHERGYPPDVFCLLDIVRHHPLHVFMLLTKRPSLMKKFFVGEQPHANVWLGVTVCDQEEADEKIPILLSMPAAKRFVSVEPMLGSVEFLHGNDIDPPVLPDWVICGGETGPGARPMNPDWARSLRDQCREARVPFFFKKMAGKSPIPDGLMIREIPT